MLKKDKNGGGYGINGRVGSHDGGGDEHGCNGGGDESMIQDGDGDQMAVDEGADMAVYIVMRGSVADGSALTYTFSNAQFIEYLLADESCLHVLETWFLLSMEILTELQQRAKSRDMMLAMDLHKDNYPVILDLVLFELFSQYLARKQQQGGEDLSATAYKGCHSVLMCMFCCSKYP